VSIKSYTLSKKQDHACSRVDNIAKY